MKGLALVPVGALLVACASNDDATDPEAAVSAHAIGHRSAVYDLPGDNDTLPVEIYYPATNAGEEAPVATGEFPLVIFAHGYQQGYLDYAYVWEALVPRGTIVALVDKLSGATAISTDEHAGHIVFLIDQIEALGADPASDLFGHVGDRIAVTGHSTGGGADFIAAAQSPSVSTIASLAPLAVAQPPNVVGTDPVDVAGQVSVPTLILAGGEDCITPTPENAEVLHAAVAGSPRYFVEIQQGDHCGFSDAGGPGRLPCETAELSRCPGLPLGTAQGPTLDPADQNARSLEVFVPWIDHHLRDDAGAWDAFEASLTDLRVLHD
jgi:predicted dienelactone hydrolase